MLSRVCMLIKLINSLGQINWLIYHKGSICLWPIIGDPRGSLLGNFYLRWCLWWCVIPWGTYVDSTHEGVLSTPWGNFLHNFRGGCPCALDPRVSNSMILYFTGDSLIILTHEGVSLGISILPRNVLNAFNSLWNVLRVFVSFIQLRVFLSLLYAFLNFLLHFLLSGNPLGIFDFFYFSSCILVSWILFKTLGWILRTSFAFLFLLKTCT